MCPYPVEEFNNFLHGPVLSHVEAIDRRGERAPFVRSTFGPGFWVFTEGDLVQQALQSPQRFSSSVVTPLEPDPQYLWIPEMLDPPELNRPGIRGGSLPWKRGSEHGNYRCAAEAAEVP